MDNIQGIKTYLESMSFTNVDYVGGKNKSVFFSAYDKERELVAKVEVETVSDNSAYVYVTWPTDPDDTTPFVFDRLQADDKEVD